MVKIKDNKEPDLVWLRHFSAGICAGAMSRSCTAPIDRLRTFFQVYGMDHAGRMTIKTTLSSMIHEGGIQGLWRGNLMNILKVSPEIGVRMMSYEQYKRLLGQTNEHEITVAKKFICGSMAGFTATCLIYPMKTIKTRLTIRRTNEYKSIYDCIRKIYHTEGPLAFYKGILPNILAILPASGIDFALYETLKRYVEYKQNRPSGSIEKLLLGNVSIGVANLFVYPLLQVRSRLQSNVNRTDTMTHIFKTLWKKRGIRGFYNGFGLHMLKMGPASGISFATFEFVAKLLGTKAL